MDKVQKHTHNAIDSEQLSMKDAIIGCPMPALTSDAGGSLSSGGVGDLKNSDSTIIANMRTRINELEARLQAIQALL